MAGNRHEKGDLVLDGFEVVEFITEETDKEGEIFNRVFSLENGEYLISILTGLEDLKNSPDYERIVRLWNINKDRHLEQHKGYSDILVPFCKKLKVPNGIKVWYGVDGRINIFDVTRTHPLYENNHWIDTIKLDMNHFEKSDEYKSFVKEHIHRIIQNYMNQ